MKKTKTVVKILGRDYTITGSDTEEHIQRVAAFVDRKMEELRMSTRLPEPMVSVLTAMNLADELIKAQDENTRLRGEMLEAKAPAGKKTAKKIAEE